MKKEKYIRPKIEALELFVEEGLAVGSPQNQKDILVEDWEEEVITKRFDVGDIL